MQSSPQNLKFYLKGTENCFVSMPVQFWYIIIHLQGFYMLNVYLHFRSFMHSETSQVVKILYQGSIEFQIIMKIIMELGTQKHSLTHMIRFCSIGHVTLMAIIGTCILAPYL